MSLSGFPPVGVLPGKGGKVGFDPAGPRLWAGQRCQTIETGQQALVEQRGMPICEGTEVGAARIGVDVVGDDLHPLGDATFEHPQTVVGVYCRRLPSKLTKINRMFFVFLAVSTVS